MSELELEQGRMVAGALVCDLQENPGLMAWLDKTIAQYGDETPRLLTQLVKSDVEGGYQPPLFPNVHAAILMANAAGMGQWGAIISTGITAISQAASTIYSAKVNADALKDVAEIKASTERQQLATQQAQAEAAEAAARAQLEQLILQQQALSTLPPSQTAAQPAQATQAAVIPGTSVPILPIAIAGGVGLLALFVVVPMLKRRRS